VLEHIIFVFSSTYKLHETFFLYENFSFLIIENQHIQTCLLTKTGQTNQIIRNSEIINQKNINLTAVSLY
jgi:hypothetical protein